MPARPKIEVGPAAAPRKPLLGFLLCGLLMSLPAALVPAWGYHLTADFSRAGGLYLAMTLGFLFATPLARRLLHWKGIPLTMVTGSSIAVLSAVYLSGIPAAFPDLWRYAGVASTGLAAGLLNTATFHAIGALFRQDSAATVNLSGILFGLGCLLSAILLAATLNEAGTTVVLFGIASIGGLCATIFTSLPVTAQAPLRSTKPGGYSSPSAIIFGLLLFFQFGNEWAIAGWIAIFVIHRLGVSPVTSLWVLALYWAALLIGRVTAQWLFGTVRHSRLMPANAAAALVGCTILAVTDNLFGVVLGILLVGFAFASMYPLVVERIGNRFPYYHPGLFNGIFSFALIGGMLAPWTLGYFANWFGIQIVMALPVMGTGAVLLLLVVIWIETKFSARGLN